MSTNEGLKSSVAKASFTPYIKVKVKLSRYRPEQALADPQD
jgi:hypothetical protein